MSGIPKVGYPHAKIPRRDFLHIGALGAAGLVLNCLPFNRKIVASGETINRNLNIESPHEIRFTTPDRKDPSISLIVIDLQGGASWFDMFDRKPNSPFKIFNPKDTTCPEITISEPLAPLAKHLHKLVVFRNFFNNNTFHDAASAKLYTGIGEQTNSSFNASAKYPSGFTEFSKYLSDRTSPYYGYLVTHSSGQRHEIVGDEEDEERKEQLRDPWRLPFCGTHYNHDDAIYAPYNTITGKFGIELTSNDDEYQKTGADKTRDIEVVKSRLKFLEEMERLGHSLAGPPIDRWKKFHGKINNVLEGDITEAFDLSQEPEEIRLRYGMGEFGKQLLLARRLAQRGVRITVAQRGDWDHHEFIEKNLNIYLPEFAIAFSALLDDIERLGLKIVVAVVSEFGRTEKINSDGGRDHWPIFGAVLGGYGIEGGKLIGKTDYRGYTDDRIPAEWVVDTLLDRMYIARFELRNGQPTNNRFAYTKF